jgi:phytoene dehydrogenase-like protein
MLVHLPDGLTVARYGDERRWAEHQRAFGASSLPFWRRQEATADALWELALATPPWPPQTPGEALRLAQTGLRWLAADPAARLHPALLGDALRPVAAHLHGAPQSLRDFVDAQLLISAQTTGEHANALYGASALDLPRRGVVHLRGGIGAIAGTLAQAVCDAGGKVLHRHEVTSILVERGRVTGVQTKRSGRFAAGVVIANLPPWNTARLLGAAAPPKLRRLPDQTQAGWGAFMLYVGLDAAAVPAHHPLHHQVVARRPLGEGNSLFLSLSPAWDAGRAPPGKRALTISTHTALAPWWRLHDNDPQGYAARKQRYVEHMLCVAERALPGLRKAAGLVLPGTPVTFQRFTRREHGWVGGFPQTNLLRGWGPRLLPGLWMVGDSIFPGQSTAAVALGGLRVAQGVLARYNERVSG